MVESEAEKSPSILGVPGCSPHPRGILGGKSSPKSGIPQFSYSNGWLHTLNLCKSTILKRKKHNTSQPMGMSARSDLYIGLSPLPVIVEMKVYRHSLLKM